jgi:hypothetical protein
MSRRRIVQSAAVSLAAVAAAATSLAAGPAQASAAHDQHVLLLSVDGMHQADLSWWVRAHPDSALAALVKHGEEFTHAMTPFPSDSFPGMVGQVTGGDPRTTGIYYDVTYNHALLDPTTSTSATPTQAECAAAAPGGNVPFDESIDRDNSRLDAGQGLPNLPSDILDMTAHPQSLIDPTQLPIDPSTCTRVYPHQYLKVNTVFEVARAHGLRTAWSDKHPAYEILNGPSGTGVQDLFTPEINSDAPAGGDWTSINSSTQQYDGYKVQAVLNEIAGLDHSGRHHVGTPAVFGMNFQSLSTAQKLPTSDGKTGGYSADGPTPGPVVRSALQFIDDSVARMVKGLKQHGEFGATTIILSAKHGQSPMDSASLTRIDDGAILDALNASWAQQHPSRPQPLVAASLDDDGMLLWFTNGDRTALADDFATDFLNGYNGNGTGNDGQAKATDIDVAPKAYTHAGLTTIHAGAAAARFMGVPANDERVPDLIGIVQHGVVYTGKAAKIAEHGGDDPQDRNVPLIVAGPGIKHGTRGGAVETTQIAPTILSLLGLNPRELDAVRIQGTAALP